METNLKMRRLLQAAHADPATFKNDAFVQFDVLSETDGCLVLASIKTNKGLSDFEDKTSFEAAVNKVSFWEDGAEPERLAAWVLLATQHLKTLLGGYPMGGKAQIVGSVTPTSASVRFYLLREEEDPWVLQDLESYTDEGVAVSDVEVGGAFWG